MQAGQDPGLWGLTLSRVITESRRAGKVSEQGRVVDESW